MNPSEEITAVCPWCEAEYSVQPLPDREVRFECKDCGTEIIVRFPNEVFAYEN